ncbi:Ldh family oxidoreductase [Algihabitans albus]|uniref:Ldh family oxidoreductase n=1 Tax=Algihabitans albus TaxID=2164067 RepID=UPI001ABC3C01|nr:Ldh family oxidoreductase [Algihabitans albus]
MTPQEQRIETSDRDGDKLMVPARLVEAQLRAVLSAWGMPAEQTEITTRIMLATDLRGVDSHGIGLLPLYDELRQAGKLTMAPQVEVLRETPVTALLDAGGGLGHYPGDRAMRLAIEKCRSSGLAAVAVRNSNHFGAAGIYALLAAEAGFIGLATSNVWNAAVVPTRGREPMFGTNPLAFAAPAGRNPPFCLDIATSTVAIGKLRLAWLEGRDLPEGWAVDEQGHPTRDAAAALALRLLTPLGSRSELSSHKGYGLAAMVEVLSAMLSGASFAVLRDPDADRLNVGHFFLALDPAAFRDRAEFEAEMDEMIDRLRASRPVDPALPVLVPGDPEITEERERQVMGVPVSRKLAVMLRDVAQRCGARYLLETPAG